MEFENILKLIDSVSASKLDSFVYEQNGTKIRLEKKKQKIQITESRLWQWKVQPSAQRKQ